MASAKRDDDDDKKALVPKGPSIEEIQRVKTVGEAQLEQSREYEREGIEAWKAKHDDRVEKETKVHPGVRR